MDLIETLETDSQVGAFAVTGNRGRESNEDEETFQDTPLTQIQRSQNPMAVTITTVQLVDNVIVFDDVIVDETSIKGNCINDSILRYMIIAIVFLLMAIIIPSVILTRQLPSNSPNADTGSICLEGTMLYDNDVLETQN
jgi:hypothetical protein